MRGNHAFSDRKLLVSRWRQSSRYQPGYRNPTLGSNVEAQLCIGLLVGVRSGGRHLTNSSGSPPQCKAALSKQIVVGMKIEEKDCQPVGSSVTEVRILQV